MKCCLSIVVGVFLFSCSTPEKINTVNTVKVRSSNYSLIDKLNKSVVVVVNSKNDLSGTGFVWSKNHIVTNYHVIDDLSDPHIEFKGDKKLYRCKVIGVNIEKDIAVLELIDKTKNLIPVLRKDMKQLKLGEAVFAIGHPLDLRFSVSRGIVSKVHESYETGFSKSKAIQTDATVNPGNSGGPLFDEDGMFVGVCSFILTKSGMSNGLSFAVHGDDVRDSVSEIILGFDSLNIFRSDTIRDEVIKKDPKRFKITPHNLEGIN